MVGGGAGAAIEQEAFDALKQALTTAPVLAHPDPQRQWTVQTDASGVAIGGVLSQQQDDGTMRPVAFWSHKLNSAQRNYSATERELMAHRVGDRGVAGVPAWQPTSSATAVGPQATHVPER